MTFSAVKIGLCGLLLASASGWVVAAQAGTTLTYQDQDNSGAQAFVIKVQAPYLRMDEAGGMWMLYDSKADVLYAVQPAEQSYTRMDRAKAQQLGGIMEAMQEQLKHLPPEQRAAVEKMMGHSMAGGDKPKMEYVLTKDSRKRAGVNCQVGHLVRDGKVRHEFCVAKPGDLGMADADYAVMSKMFELMSALRETAGSFFGQEMPDPTELKGVAIESSGQNGGHHVLKSFGQAKIDAGQFKIPESYRQEVIPNITP